MYVGHLQHLGCMVATVGFEPTGLPAKTSVKNMLVFFFLLDFYIFILYIVNS